MAAVLLLAGCDGVDIGSPQPGDGKDRTADGRAVSPLENTRGTGPGLAPLTSDGDRAAARRLMERLPVKGRGPRTGYDRDEFGYAWMDSADGVPLAHNDRTRLSLTYIAGNREMEITRNDLLKRDGDKLRFRSGSDCVVVSMSLHDPYSGKDIDWRKQKATAVQIDHVVPLSYSWQMGSSRWSKDRREQLANDPLNLLPVDGPTNSGKGDSGPASWLPPDKRIRCSYVVRFTQVALKYAVAVTSADKAAMLGQCGR